ncbi:hypothetical protein OOK29_09935 [Streptomyces phaeochromogenes]|uniref:hypothetical protein n=1 Tax=Streptomyces phaeochromogenes TaxID=1923 RepID=UPI0022538A6F|nr:hypothetical protein [Streptomyces phaeochromogenes]MCX5598458.1 hypothetical protein [Streptomyces phaeochromogenes]
MAAPRKTTASSRKPRTAARAASRPATSRRAAEPEVDEELTAAEAQEVEAEGHYVMAMLCEEEVQIIPPSAWRSSWQRMLNQGDLDGFAEKVFHPEDYELYLELDPTIVEFIEFTQEAASRTGESLGKSSGPAPSSRRTRRR